MSFRNWLNVVMFSLIALVLFFARDDLVHAWHLLGQVDLALFLWILPVQFASYYTSGAVLFSFLRAKGDLQHTSKFEQPIMALELNFVNHVLPTAGVSGASYMTWRLSKLGVNTGRATLAQVVRFAVVFFSYAVLLLVAVVLVTLDSGVNRVTILATSGLIGIIVVGTLFAVYAVNSRARLQKFAAWLDQLVNHKIRRLVRSKKSVLVQPKQIQEVLFDIHDDYLLLRRKPQLLVRPFLWGLVFNVMETLMFFIAFLALGAVVNPALILIGIGLAGLVGTFMATPGGAGGFEIAMAFFLTSTGVPSGLVAAGIVLTRTVLIVLTIVSGYFFYHRAVKKYGKSPAER